MNFRELVADMDDAIEEELLDDGIIDGQPVRGKFDAPWLDARIGALRTDLTQPQFAIRTIRLGTTVEGSVVETNGAQYEVVSLEDLGNDWTVLVLRPV